MNKAVTPTSCSLTTLTIRLLRKTVNDVDRDPKSFGKKMVAQMNLEKPVHQGLSHAVIDFVLAVHVIGIRHNFNLNQMSEKTRTACASTYLKLMHVLENLLRVLVHHRHVGRIHVIRVGSLNVLDLLFVFLCRSGRELRPDLSDSDFLCFILDGFVLVVFVKLIQVVLVNSALACTTTTSLIISSSSSTSILTSSSSTSRGIEGGAIFASSGAVSDWRSRDDGRCGRRGAVDA